MYNIQHNFSVAGMTSSKLFHMDCFLISIFSSVMQQYIEIIQELYSETEANVQ